MTGTGSCRLCTPEKMARKTLPPLAWLRAFSEAGRTESFKEAAQSMHVTPSTVSHEIRKLEDWLSLPLFHRKGRRLELTEEGRRLHEGVGHAFDALREAVSDVVEEEPEARVGMFPFLASEVVVPNRDELATHLGNRRIKIDANIHLSSLTAPERSRRCDAIVRYAERPAAGFEAIELTRVRLGPVASSEYLATRGHRNLCSLSEDRIVRVDGPFKGWEAWCESVGVSWEAAEDVIGVDNYVTALRVVEHGAGIGLCLLPITRAWLEVRRLEMLEAPFIELPERYWLVFPPHSPHRECLERFAAWLSQKIAG